ncbi:D-2-hydroxyacid dehydrogenase [Flavitalea sp.]|nr:D-2-hydroxyacid dehydrogenase [Flavitalea sp.]
MKIVALDGYTLNPGDLNWIDIEEFGELTVYERTPAELVVERCKEAVVILTNKTAINKEMIGQLPQLKFISVLATGYNIVDVSAAREKGVVVSNVPGYGTASVVQLTFALMLEHFNQVSLHNQAVKAGDWVNSKDFSFTKTPLHELQGKTIGIIGFGSIGRQVCDVATVFGMHTLAYSRTKTNQGNRINFDWAELDSLLSKSDVITIHCPLTDETKGMINKSTLALMKKTALIVNTARGPIINENDLAEALNQETIGGAALDVLSKEPPEKDNPLLKSKSCIITPHIGWATVEARGRLMNGTVANVKSFIEGKPVNVVN